MPIHDLPLQQLIIELIEPNADKMMGTVIDRWERIAIHLISIIGEGGFNSLYERSVILTQSKFPWLLTRGWPSTDHRFIALKASLEDQPPALADEANGLLLANFTGILESLIGAQLTIRIFQSALKDTRLPTEKVLNNE